MNKSEKEKKKKKKKKKMEKRIKMLEGHQINFRPST